MKITVYNLSGMPTADVGIFKELQEDFKIFDQNKNEKLQALILKRGFKYAFKAWKDPDGQLWIIDAHQRKKALLQLKQKGYEIPPIPYELIHANNKKEAVEEIAAYNSEFAAKNPDTILFEKYDIDLDSLSQFELSFGEKEDVLNDLNGNDVNEETNGTLLHRLGNKTLLVKHGLLHYFPPHDLYVELFFGAGGVFFNKPKAKFNVCNDVDSDVYNLFQTIKTRKEDLREVFSKVPKHQDLLEYWKKNQEPDPVYKAARFLFLSNFTYLGKGQTLGLGFTNDKQITLDRFDETYDYIQDVQFLNSDFRDVPKKISLKQPENKERAFIYADPPYLDTDNNYSQGFKESDTEDLFLMLSSSDVRFAISEFDHPKILELAEHYNLLVLKLGERRNLGNRRMEVLVCNYEPENVEG